MTFTHAKRIAGYSWPLYAAAGITIAVGSSVALVPTVPPAIRWLAAVGVGIATWYACASFVAFHWMFDRSGLLGGRWLEKCVDAPPRRWVEINAGLDETTVPVGEVFRDATGTILDVYDLDAMTEPAIGRARTRAPGAASIAAKPDALPVESGAGDLVLVMLVAHEIRKAREREAFFLQLRRIVAPDGRIVLVEHLRDLAAAAAFGPGVSHFLPRREWMRLATLAGLELRTERSITPFVRVFVFRPMSHC